jgi:hypothetical protein
LGIDWRLKEGFMDAAALNRKPIAWSALASLYAGLLALLPYLGILVWPLLYGIFVGAPPQQNAQARAVLIWVFNFMAIAGSYSGLPLGLASIILGTIGLKVSPRGRESRVASVSGILLGAGGIAGELWLFTNRICLPCP